MDPGKLRDRIAWGYNIVARSTGRTVDAFRPHTAWKPLSGVHRYLRLPAAFVPGRGGLTNVETAGDPWWRGCFDKAYTRPGDYLVRDDLAWFVAAQGDFSLPLCVLTNRVLSFARSQPGSGASDATTYGAVAAGTATPLAAEWPASVLGAAGGARPQAALPGDNTLPSWIILLPPIPNVVLSPSDLVMDDLGRSGVIVTAELSHLGWRLGARQATV